MADTRTLLAQILQGPARARPWGVPASALDTTMTNPVGTSRVFPPQVLTNPSPAFSPMIGPADMTRDQLLGAMTTRGERGRPPLASDLPAMDAAGQQFFDNAVSWAGMTTPIVKGIRAYHGSPHTFDKFDMSKLGTGEGAQAYGHGLYFAGNENVAKSYKNALSGAGNARVTGGMSPVEEFIFDRISQNADDFSIIKDLGRRYGGSIGFDEAQAALDKVRSLNKGSMYEVNLRTSPERLLDWDKPLSGQPAGVREALAKVPWAEDYIKSERLTGGQIAPKTPEGATQLREAGLDGIQYLDGGSRAAGEGSRNYVMFDDKLVEILRRYGLLGMLGGGAAATATQGDQ
jgi:hypothetical protein